MAEATKGERSTARARIAGGGSTALRALAAIVDVVVAIVAVIIVAGILFVVLKANAKNSIVHDVHDAAKFLVGPFDGMFKPKDHRAEIAVNWGIALAVYVFVGRFLAAFLRRHSLRGD